MNRKGFINSVLASVAAVPALSILPYWARSEDVAYPGAVKRPPYLKPGDQIGITCPAGYITEEEIQPALRTIESWGFRIKMGNTVGKRDYGFGGTDDERAADLQKMINDPTVKAILCARGGYGSVRIIDRINFTPLVQRPKWIIGFSDITVIHSHLNHNYGIASLHSKMCNSFPEDWLETEPLQRESILSIRKALTGEYIHYPVVPSAFNKGGIGEGPLVGGNLKTLETLSGSASDLYTAGKILFVEDTGEYLYSIDRMFWNLKRTGKLSKLKGLIVGGFRIKPDDPGEEFGRSLEEIVLEKVKDYQYPVCFDFPVGHQKNNFALKCGLRHQLQVSNKACLLTEIK